MLQQRPSLAGHLFGSYRLLRLIGTGGFAEVYLGEHLHQGTQVAIKVLHTQLIDTDIDTFRTEARTIARLRHPHIIRVLDFNVEDSMPFLVMDYAAGGTMRERYPRGTTVPLPTIVSFTQQIADALQYAHNEKIIHRDVKPENILLDEHDKAFLSDFGISLVTEDSYFQMPQDIIGTAAYMSPEQIQGQLQPSSDQYSLGIVVYEWLGGTCPFEGSRTDVWSQHMYEPPPPLREKVPTICPEVEYVVMTALHKDPKQRFGNVRAFANALQQAYQAGQTQTVTSPRLQIDHTSAASRPEPAQPIVPSYQTDNTAPARSPRDDKPRRGGQKWTFETRGPVYSSPAVVNGTVYFGSNDHNLYALDASSGQKLWSFQAGSRVESSPTVVNGVVYFGSNDHNLYALDASSGKQKWSFPASKAVYSSPRVVNGIVYFGSEDRNLYALDASSGQKLWSFRSGHAVYSSPTVANDVVYFSSDDHNLYALDARSGQKLWSFFPGDFVISSPVVVREMVYFGSEDRTLYALNAASGRQKWSFRSGDALFSSPAVANGVAYCGSTDGSLYALNAVFGQQKWSFRSGDALFSSPTVANGVVYFGSHDGNLYAIDATYGHKIWSFSIGNMMLSSPIEDNGVVYVGSHNGKLYAIFA
jgi:eukaryotic-like serine/threonine-protein kinase